MPLLTKQFKKVPGLRGSLLAMFENLDTTGPTKSLGGTPLFGSGSNPDDTGGGAGGNSGNQCGQESETGTPGSSNTTGNGMPPSSYNPCALGAPLPPKSSSVPPCGCPCDGVPGGGGGMGGGTGGKPC